MCLKKDNNLINYCHYDIGDIVRLQYGKWRGKWLEGLEEHVCEVVGERCVRRGIIRQSSDTYYALRRLDKESSRIIILETDEINRHLISKKFHMPSCWRSEDFQISISVYAYEDCSANEIHIDNLLISPTIDEFKLICEEIHSEFNSLIKQHDGYHPDFHDKLDGIVKEWIHKDEKHRHYSFIMWRLSDETREMLMKLIGINENN